MTDTATKMNTGTSMICRQLTEGIKRERSGWGHRTMKQNEIIIDTRPSVDDKTVELTLASNETFEYYKLSIANARQLATRLLTLSQEVEHHG